MIKRPRQIDYFRTVTRINVWEEFNSFDNDGMGANNGASSNQFNNAQVATINGDKNDKENALVLKKMEIPIITSTSNQKLANSAGNSQSVTDEIYKKRRIQTSNYIRIRQDQIWPVQEKYELADDDVIFLKDFNESNKFNMKEEELELMIESFEMKSGKDYIVTWIVMKDLISYDMRDKYTFTNLEKIYNYWKTKRDLFKRPLLRLHWKPYYNDKDPHVAFRPRVADKMKLRRSMKQNDEEQLQKLLALKEEMSKYKLLVQQIKLREQMKEWILESQSLSFVSELYKIDKSMQYFFVDDVLESNKEVEQKKQKLDEKYTLLHSQNNQLSEQLSTYNLFPAGYVKPSNTKNGHMFRPTPVSTNKEPKQNSEVTKPQEGNQPTSATNVTTPATTNNSVTLSNTILKAEKKNKVPRPEVVVAPAIVPEEVIVPNPEVEQRKKKKEKKNKGEQNSIVGDVSGHVFNITIPKEPKEQASATTIVTPSTKQPSHTSTTTIAQKEISIILPPIPPSTKLTAEKEVSQPKGKAVSKKEKLAEDAIAKQSTKQTPSEPPSQIIDPLKLDKEEVSKSVNDGKEDKSSSLPNLSLFNTDNFEFASFIASIFIEASKRELTVEKVCNIDTKSIDREQFSNILNSKSELAVQLKKLHKATHGPSPNPLQGSSFKNPPMSNDHIPSNYQNQPPYQHLTHMGGKGGMVPDMRRQSQYLTQGGQQYSDQLSNPNLVQDNSHVKKKNVIPFKPRLRIGRSGLVNIDRQFDDKDNLRYEDICSKEANYHPNKIVDKILAQQRMKERAEQQKLKVYSFTPTDTELYKKDYFQQRQLKFKQLADDDETQLIYPSAPSSTNIGGGSAVTAPVPSSSAGAPVSSQALSSSQGYSQTQLNGALTAVSSAPEGSQMQIEDSSAMTTSLTQQQLLNNEQDIKLLRKSISVALKNYQKQKQQNQLK